MMIANFFHCKNIADQVVESTRFKYMLKQAWLGELKLPTRKKLELRMSFTHFVLLFYINVMKVNY